MPKTTLAGHPLHPQLIVMPAAMLPASFAFDIIGSATGRKSFSDAAYYAMVAGVGGALAAGAAGASDYFAIPGGTHAKRVARLHGLLNLGLVGLYGANLAMRARRRRANPVSLAMSALGTAGLVVSAWYGGQLVYEHGVRVHGKADLEGSTEVKLPGDDQIVSFFSRIEEATVSVGQGAGLVEEAPSAARSSSSMDVTATEGTRRL